MAPKQRVSKDMTLHTAFCIVNEDGKQKLTVHRISERLNCSAQPVLYHFRSTEEHQTVPLFYVLECSFPL